MGRIITFSGLKDGIGKTSLASHSACLLSQLGYRVLIVDMDYIHHELTKRIFGDNALLKNLEYKENLYFTLENILSLDLPDAFPFSELPLSLCQKNPEKTEEGSLSIIPSYYREPKPFWERKFSSLWHGLPKILSFYKEIWDFVILDTLSLQDKFSPQILSKSDMVVFLSPPYPYCHSSLEEFIEDASARYPKSQFLSFENMACENKKGIPFCYDFLTFESKRPFHRKKFFWDFYQEKGDFTLSCQEWTLSMISFLQEILKQFQESLSHKKIQSFLKDFPVCS